MPFRHNCIQALLCSSPNGDLAKVKMPEGPALPRGLRQQLHAGAAHGRVLGQASSSTPAPPVVSQRAAPLPDRGRQARRAGVGHLVAPKAELAKLGAGAPQRLGEAPGAGVRDAVLGEEELPQARPAQRAQQVLDALVPDVAPLQVERREGRAAIQGLGNVPHALHAYGGVSDIDRLQAAAPRQGGREVLPVLGAPGEPCQLERLRGGHHLLEGAEVLLHDERAVCPVREVQRVELRAEARGGAGSRPGDPAGEQDPAGEVVPVLELRRPLPGDARQVQEHAVALDEAGDRVLEAGPAPLHVGLHPVWDERQEKGEDELVSVPQVHVAQGALERLLLLVGPGRLVDGAPVDEEADLLSSSQEKFHCARHSLQLLAFGVRVGWSCPAVRKRCDDLSVPHEVCSVAVLGELVFMRSNIPNGFRR
mmetsp:Transcript_48384/g.140172  ORF Transcript_48384/g.140172 Transcript_48384/m.140172 type:complete len:422 (-) Transcript_48384:517-1782(-)